MATKPTKRQLLEFKMEIKRATHPELKSIPRDEYAYIVKKLNMNPMLSERAQKTFYKLCTDKQHAQAINAMTLLDTVMANVPFFPAYVASPTFLNVYVKQLPSNIVFPADFDWMVVKSSVTKTQFLERERIKWALLLIQTWAIQHGRTYPAFEQLYAGLVQEGLLFPPLRPEDVRAQEADKERYHREGGEQNSNEIVTPSLPALDVHHMVIDDTKTRSVSAKTRIKEYMTKPKKSPMSTNSTSGGSILHQNQSSSPSKSISMAHYPSPVKFPDATDYQPPQPPNVQSSNDGKASMMELIENSQDQADMLSLIIGRLVKKAKTLASDPQDKFEERSHVAELLGNNKKAGNLYAEGTAMIRELHQLPSNAARNEALESLQTVLDQYEALIQRPMSSSSDSEEGEEDEPNNLLLSILPDHQYSASSPGDGLDDDAPPSYDAAIGEETNA